MTGETSDYMMAAFVWTPANVNLDNHRQTDRLHVAAVVDDM